MPLIQEEIKVAAECARKYPKGFGNVWTSNGGNCFDSSRWIIQEQIPFGWPSIAVTVVRGHKNIKDAWKTLQDISDSLELCPDDYMGILNNNPEEIAQRLEALC